MYMGETRGPTGALVHLLCDRRLKTPGNGAAKESNLPTVGLPRLTGFEGRLGHRPRPLRGEGYARRTAKARSPWGSALATLSSTSVSWCPSARHPQPHRRTPDRGGEE